MGEDQEVRARGITQLLKRLNDGDPVAIFGLLALVIAITGVRWYRKSQQRHGS